MTIAQFPPVEYADPYGLLAIGGDLEVESLLLAYQSGIFPWPLEDRPLEDSPLTWFAPPQRALLFLNELHVHKSLKKMLRKPSIRCIINHDVPAVIRECRLSPHRAKGNGTWITEEIEHAYGRLAEAGYCHSIAAFDGDHLLGGLYGVSINNMFAGESMFYHSTNGSKIALVYLATYLRSRGAEWIDCQQTTTLIHSFGARLLPRKRFMSLLTTAVRTPASLFPADPLVLTFNDLAPLFAK